MGKKQDDDKLWGFLGVFLGILGFILIMLARRNNKYAMHYGKQGLIITIAYLIILVVGAIPFIGWIISLLGSIVLLVLWIIGIVYSVSGEVKDVPVIGEFARKINV